MMTENIKCMAKIEKEKAWNPCSWWDEMLTNCRTSFLVDFVTYVCFGQVYRDRLVKLLDQSISLEPLTTSIQDFASAVREFDHELNVKGIYPIDMITL